MQTDRKDSVWSGYHGNLHSLRDALQFSHTTKKIRTPIEYFVEYFKTQLGTNLSDAQHTCAP